MEQNKIHARPSAPFSIEDRPVARAASPAQETDPAVERQNAILEKISEQLQELAGGQAESKDEAAGESDGLMKKLEELIELLLQLFGGGKSSGATDTVGPTGQPATQQ